MVLNRVLRKRHNCQLRWTVFVLAFLLMSPLAQAEILFEGFMKVMTGGAHAGYAIIRYEFDAKKQEFICTSFLKTNQLAGNTTESYKARSTKTMKPIAFQYTGLLGETTKTIDVTFKGDKMVGVIKEGSKTNNINKSVPKGAFLSSFLAYLMLQSKEGIKTGVKYNFMAIAEEDGGIYPGEAFVASSETHMGFNAFKVLNRYKNTQYISYVTAKGEMLSTKSPVLGIATELVPTLQQAAQGMAVNSSNLTTIFGTMPQGKENIVAKKSSTPAADATAVKLDGAGASAASGPSASVDTPPGSKADDAKKKILYATPTPDPTQGDSGKKSGVPGGQGIIIKGAPPPSQPEGK